MFGKGSFISEHFSVWLKSPQKWCQITTFFFGDWSQNEKLSEIKPTSIKSVLYENEFTYGLAIVQFLSHTFKMLKQSRFLNHDYNLVT